MTPFVTPFIAGLGTQEIVLIIVVILLLFGATKLPELARGSGRALRIFKAETKGLMDDDDDSKTDAQRQIDARAAEAEARETQRQAEAERIARERRDGTS